MRYFRRRIVEVAQPKAEDEINFKEKHVIDHIIDPNAEEDQFTADMIKKFKNRADYERGQDALVYEASLRHDRYGEEDADIDNDGNIDLDDAQLRYRRKAHIKQKIVDEALDPVGKEDHDIDNDRRITSSDSYLRARRRAITKKLQKEGLLSPVVPAGGEYDSDESHTKYKKSNRKHKIYYTENLGEAFKAGLLKLKDGSSVTLSKEDTTLLNDMFGDLNPTNRKRMQDVLMTDKNGFKEIIGFAREAL